MTRQRHPNECPKCEKIPCRCKKGGSAADEEISEEGSEINEVSKANKTPEQLFNETLALMVLLGQNGQLPYGMFFNSVEEPGAIVSSKLLQDDEQTGNGEQVENTSSTGGASMGMNMGSTGD